LSVWLFLLTAKGATIHQILDYANDRDTNLQTFAVRYGMQAAVVLTDAVVFALFALALAGLACFDYPLNAIVFLLVAFSNPRYRRAQTQR
jgi:4-hydroxybenzoate polyprenyltransferase